MRLPRFRSTVLTVIAYVVSTVLVIVLAALGRGYYHVRLPDTALTAEQKSKPYAAYFDRPIAAPAPGLEEAIAAPMDCKDALPINEINTLLDPGYQKVETGYCVFDDGGGYASVNIKMPGVTLDMVNWWFIWHPQESLRYKIWDKDDHFSAQISDEVKARYDDTSLAMSERLWDTTHHIRENIGIPLSFRLLMGVAGQDPYQIDIHFISPKECGFDMTRFDFTKETVVCSESGMRHYVRKTADGVELRTRFYAGYVKKDGEFVREGSAAPLSIEAGLNHHMVKEFSNLASILPTLYAEQGPKSDAERGPAVPTTLG